MFEGHRLDAHEVYFLVRVGRVEPTALGWTDAEHGAILDHRRWPQQELATTGETIYPERLLSILEERA